MSEFEWVCACVAMGSSTIGQTGLDFNIEDPFYNLEDIRYI